MKSIYILLVLLIGNVGCYAQQSGKIVTTVKGKIIDAKTSEPVAYTNIGLEGTFYGVASNSDGDFELNIPEELKEKDIFFSAVGFVNQKFPVSRLFEKEYNIIKLEPQNYDIDKVDVVAKSKVLIRILTIATENIPHNFVAGPLNYKATYTNLITIDNTISENQLADVLFYDQTGYTLPSKLDAYQHLKYALQKKAWDADYRFSTGTTELDNLLSFDWARTGSSVLNPEILDGFDLTLDSEPMVLGKECWVIAFTQKEPTLSGSGDFYATGFKGKITIRKDDYSVVSIEGEVQSPKNSRQGRSLAIKTQSVSTLRDVNYKFKTEYRNLMLSSISVEKTYSQNNKKIAEKSSIKVNGIQTNNLTLLDSRDYFTGE